MILSARSRLAFALLALLSVAIPSSARIWTSKSGMQLEADFSELRDSSVVLLKGDGSTVRIEQSNLSQADKEYIDSLVVGRIKTVKLLPADSKSGGYASFEYEYEISHGPLRLRRPIMSFYLMYERPDTTRKTHWARYNPAWRWDQAQRAIREPDVDINTVRRVENAERMGSAVYPDYTPKPTDKLLVFRAELWQDGRMLDSHDSQPNRFLKEHNISSDWYKR